MNIEIILIRRTSLKIKIKNVIKKLTLQNKLPLFIDIFLLINVRILIYFFNIHIY